MRRRLGWIGDPWAVTLTTLACARMTRLVTTDSLPVAQQAREKAADWIEQRAPGYGDLPHCAWCASFWIGLAATAAATAADRAGHRRIWMLACAPWAISAAVGWVADHEVA